MPHLKSFSKLALFLALVLALAMSVTTLVADETESTVEAAQEELCEEPALEAAAEELEFPVEAWFEAPELIPSPHQVECIPGGTCWADWQCGGGNRGWCNNSPGTCVCL